MNTPIAIIPQPVSIQPGEGFFTVDDATTFSCEGVDRAAGLLKRTLKIQPASTADQADIAVRLQPGCAPPEGYRLTVSPTGVDIIAPDEAGLLHGVQTLRQLTPPETMGGRRGPVQLPVVEIEDQPRFRWRAAHLDVGRHLFPVPFIKKFIDLLALHKMNIFHWHLTEDQGWRIEIDRHPLLAEVSAWRTSTPFPGTNNTSDGQRHGGYYTKREIREVVAHAERVGVTVLPEVELPGHTVAVLAAYPELGCTGGPYSVRTTWGIEDDVFCAGKDSVFGFLETVFDEVLELFPSRYIHIGGDECPKVRWSQCPDCQRRMADEGLSDEDELQSWFISQIGQYLHLRGRSMIGWDEILDGGLPPGAAVMSWRGSQGGIAAASQGHQVVMAPTSHCYFDYYQSPDRENEPPAFAESLLPLRQVYSFDPLDGVPAEHQPMILGGQSNLWTEHIPTGDQAEYQQYPRGCAMAEALWSAVPPGGRDFDGFIGRLSPHLARLDTLGVSYRHPEEHLPQAQKST